MPKLKVYTAVDTMLYSPVFLALCLEPDLLDHIELSPVLNHAESVDPWLRSVMHLREWAIGVGDPMRLTAFTNPEEVDFLGVLIDKMCFWVVDHDYDGEWFTMDKFIVHPRGMSAFTVAAHELTWRWDLDLSSADPAKQRQGMDRINALLHDTGVDPNNEMQAYLKLKGIGKPRRKLKRDAPAVKHAAFITANPLLHAKVPADGLANIYCFMDNYSKTVMTTLIGRSQACKAERALRGEFVRAVTYACGKIQDDAAYCAELLWDFWPRVHPTQTLPDGFKTREQLAKALIFLAETNVYNPDPGLLVAQANVDEACSMRSTIEPLLRQKQRVSSVASVGKRLQACVRP
jgi:hypothetical protein